jgi:rhamnulose-1-phosphate aldolase
MATVEKAAEILVKVLSMSPAKLNTITPDDFRALQEPFGIRLDERYLYEKKSGKTGER